MAKLSRIAVNSDLEVNGVWVPWFDDARVKVARHNNPRFIARVRELVMERKLQDNDPKISDDGFEDISRRAVADAILVGWENVQDEDDKQIPFSAELAYKLFCDPEHRDFYRLIVEQSMRFELFRKVRLTEMVGN